MAYKYDPSRRQLFWFVINGLVQWDRATKCFPSIEYVDEVRTNRVALGLFCRWPAHEGELLYRFNWEKKWAPRLATPSITA
jgi:hypothetical protein